MKFAKEIKPSKKLEKQLEQAVAETFLDYIFKDIFEVLEQKPLPLQNAIQDELDPDVYDANIKIIRDALYRGDIFYKDGNIQCEEGHKFGLKLSKAIKTVLSGKYNKTKKSYKIDLRKINATVRADIAVIDDNVKESVNKIQSVIETKETQEAPEIDTTKVQKAFERYYKDLDQKTRDSLKLGINQYSKENMESIRKEYIETAKYYVTKFNNRRLPKIREKLARMTLEKNLSHRELVKYIRQEFGLCERRCKFIARQEAKLARAEFIQEKATSNGMNSYMWETAHDEKVRDNPNGEDHKYLDGGIFRFDQPPIINHKTGRRANPAQDYNCRCVAKIIVSWD